jgi:hypothetical protein
MRPPGIADLVWVLKTEGIDETCANNVGNSLALLVGKTSIVVIRIWASNINLFVGCVKITTSNYWFGFF